MLGYESEAELLAVDLESQVYADPADRQRLIRQTSQEDSYEIPEVRFKTKQGKTRLVRVAGTCGRDEKGELRFCEGVIEDVTEKKLLEVQLCQSQKMEAIGRLAGGVAHDFNNLLTVIGGYSEVLLGLDAFPPQGREALHEIALASRRAASLTRQLLTFSRKQVVAPELTEIGGAIEEATRLLKRLLPADVRLQIDCQPDPIRVFIDPSQLQQLILNLTLNARDALQGSGTIAIELRKCLRSEPLLWFSGSLPPGEYALIKVRDNGIGMSAETVENIFEPFFTTKDLGSGTGLGLATVYGIVQQAGGGITVESLPGQGTLFMVFLPLATAAIADGAASGKPAEDRSAPIGSETILLVEDEQIVRDFIAHAIRRLGYTVIAADSGPGAIQSSQDHRGEVHALITDVILGEMSGPEVATAIRNQRPEIAVLFMSGYNDDALLNRGVMMQEIAFLAKPFSTEQLARKLRELLAKAPSHKA
jgi:two-component system, cell cycle sensor histidine kinase and response regulator CckA